MNEFVVFKENEFYSLEEMEKKFEGTYIGFVYMIDFGECTKIGCTKKPHTRLKQHIACLRSYGDWSATKILVTVPHTNYTENEQIVHKFFSEYRKGETELFGVQFDEAVQQFSSIGLKYRDDTAELTKKANAAFEGFKEFLSEGLATYDDTIRYIEHLEVENECLKIENECLQNEIRCDAVKTILRISGMFDNQDLRTICAHYGAELLNGGVPVFPFPTESCKRLCEILGTGSIDDDTETVEEKS